MPNFKGAQQIYLGVRFSLVFTFDYNHKIHFLSHSTKSKSQLGKLTENSIYIIDVKNLEKGIKNLKKPGFNPKNKKP